MEFSLPGDEPKVAPEPVLATDEVQNNQLQVHSEGKPNVDTVIWAISHTHARKHAHAHSTSVTFCEST